MSVSIDTDLPPLFEQAVGSQNSWMISPDANTGGAIKFDDLAM